MNRQAVKITVPWSLRKTRPKNQCIARNISFGSPRADQA
jgi:hypothetical protein